jgi:GxxExxY protein
MDLLYKDEAYRIVGAAMDVYNTLGPGFLEAVYQESPSLEMKRRGIPFNEQHAIRLFYKGDPLQHTYVADFLAYDKIIVEIKAIKQLSPTEEAQLLNYLKASRLKLGLLINFGNPSNLEWPRRILSRNTYQIQT